MNEEELIDIEFTKEQAKKYFKEEKYVKAEIIYRKLWNESNKKDIYLLYNLGQTLRKNFKQNEFIKICRENKKIIKNEYIISVLTWCIYDIYIKDFKRKEEKDFDFFLQEAKFIITNIKQLSKKEFYKNPYVLTVFKVIKVYKESASVNYNEILNWVNLLNPNELPEEEKEYKDTNGNTLIRASLKEFYYQYKTKALEKLSKYEECVCTCEESFNNIKKFHYRNNVWIEARLLFCKCMIVDEENLDDAINKYKSMAYKENHWYMYHKLMNTCWRCDRLDEALLYGNKAITCGFEYEKMINLLYDLGMLWENNGNIKNAKIYYQACCYYRNIQGWKISEELEYKIINYELDLNKKPNKKDIVKTSKDYVENIEGKLLRGKIAGLFKGYGFINCREFKENIYFQYKDVINNKYLKNNLLVEFNLSCNDKGRIAKNIRIGGIKNGRNMY